MSIQKKPVIMTTAKMADTLGISDRRLQQLVSEGLVEKEGRGRYDVKKTVQSYLQYKLDEMKTRQSTGSLLEEETRLKKLKADLAQLELDVKRGELIPVHEVKNVWQKFVAAARTRLLGIHSNIKTEHPEIPTKVVVSIEKRVRDVLEEMSHDGVPERYRGTVE